MDAKQFDGLTRLIGSGRSRRAALKTLAGGAMGALAAAAGLSGAGAAGRKRGAGDACAVNADCASNLCAPDIRMRGRKVCACGSPVDCPPAVDGCHAAACVAGGCGFSVKTGAACDDGDKCTTGDVCQPDGGCKGTPVVCVASDQCRLAGVCDEQTGLCSNPAKANDVSCDDGNACTTGDACEAGVCTGGITTVCAARDQCHDAGTCDPITGNCSNPAKANGSACDDGDSCTIGDTCQTGTCTAGAARVCAATDQCHDAGVCDTSTGACSNPAKANGAACNDGNACTQTDTCLSGVCTGSNPVVCTTANECLTAGTCNAQTGVCGAATPKAEGTTCSTGVCHQQTCCAPVAKTTTCAGACGIVVNNCGQSITCDPCPCTVAGTVCTPPEGSGAVGICQSDLRCCVTGTGFSGGVPGQWCSAVNCCDGGCNVVNSHCITF